MARFRSLVAHLVWWASAAVAIGLAVGVLLVGLRAPASHAWVEGSYHVLDALGGGVLDRRGLVVDLTGVRSALGVALVSWGLASGLWLVVGLVVASLLRPTSGSVVRTGGPASPKTRAREMGR